MGGAGIYRGAKFSLFEGGIRVPAIISWAGRLPENEVRAQVAYGCDWLPTIAELCGVKVPEVMLDGKSLGTVIRDARAPSPHAVLQWQIGKSWAVREGDWKLLFDVEDTTEALAGEGDPRGIPGQSQGRFIGEDESCGCAAGDCRAADTAARIVGGRAQVVVTHRVP